VETGDGKDDWALARVIIKNARRRANLSVRAAAHKSGLSEGWWRAFEKGTKSVGRGLAVPANPRRESFIAAARAVGLDPIAVLDNTLAHLRDSPEAQAEWLAHVERFEPRFDIVSDPPTLDTVDARIAAVETTVTELLLEFRDLKHQIETLLGTQTDERPADSEGR
jgi:transcriptional regulator with XRE-family HTH domain